MKIRNSFLFFVLSAAVLATGCRREEDEDRPTYDTGVTQDLSRAEYETEQLSDIASDAINYSTQDPDGKRSSTSIYVNSCVTATVSPAWPDTTFPKTIVLDFGSGCQGSDGRFRSGQLEVVTTGKYRDSGTVYTVSSSNYVVDGFLVTGTKTVTNEGLNSDNHMVFDIDINSTVTKPDSTVITYTSTRERKWVDGINTNVFNSGVGAYLDDVYWITGSAQGQSSSGNAYTSQITDKIVVELSCPHPVSGVLEVTPNGSNTRTLDWGNGNCDNLVTISVAGFSITVGV